MHEATQRALCRTAFVVAGALPVFVSLAFVLIQFFPAYQGWRARHWEQWLEQQLGIDVTVAAVEPLSPHRLMIHGVKLGHPESQATVGRIKCIELSFGLRGCAASLLSLELEAKQLKTASKIIHDFFLCRPERHAQALEIKVNELNIRGRDVDSIAFKDVKVDVHPLAQALVASVKFCHSDVSPGETIEFKIKRDREELQPATRIELLTGSTPLPCWLLAEFSPALETLGNTAALTGSLEINGDNEEYRLELRRVLVTGIDLSRWTAVLATPLTGQGQLYLNSAICSHRGLEFADGRLLAQSGRISQALLVAANKYLDVWLSADVQTGLVSTLCYENLALDFTLSIDGIRLQGALVESNAVSDRSPTNYFLSDLKGGIASTRYNRPLPIDNIVETCNQASGLVLAASGGESKAGAGTDGRRVVKWLALGEPVEHTRGSPASLGSDQPATDTRASSMRAAMNR